MGTLKSTIVSLLVAAVAVGVIKTAGAADSTMAQKFAADRLAFFSKGDAAAILNQYAEDATVITPQGVLHGRAQIKGMVDGIIAEFAQPGVKFELKSQTSEGPIVTFVWAAETGKAIYHLGAETYVLKDGLAQYQTLAASMNPR